MNKKVVAIIFFVTFLIIGLGGYFLSRPEQTNNSAVPVTSYEYFWGENCPHCKNVADFLDSWDKKDKINITKYEVYNNKDNATLMSQRAKECGLSLGSLGVPFMVTPDGQCITGDTPIIDHFKGLTF